MTAPFLHVGLFGWALRINPLGLWLVNADRLEDEAAVHAEHCDCNDEDEDDGRGGGSVGMTEDDLTGLFGRLYDRELTPGEAFAEFLVCVRAEPDEDDEQ